MKYDFCRILTCQILANLDGAIRRLMGRSDAGTPFSAATISAESFHDYPFVEHLDNPLGIVIMEQMVFAIVDYGQCVPHRM